MKGHLSSKCTGSDLGQLPVLYQSVLEELSHKVPHLPLGFCGFSASFLFWHWVPLFRAHLHGLHPSIIHGLNLPLLVALHCTPPQ